ncbi:MAG: kynureninase, partial [Gemmatimonadetes bacterium]|nr:kynureninase [Gemmatimonadota bacterium]
MTRAADPELVSSERDHARSLDAADPLAPYRDRFSFPKKSDGSPVVYLLGNSLGLMPDSARAAVEAELRRWGSLGVDGHFQRPDGWLTYQDVFRDKAARLVGAQPNEIVFMNTLTMNLHVMLISFYQPQGARTKILIEENAFPSDRYALGSQVRIHGLDPSSTVIVARARKDEVLLRTEDIEALLDERGDEIALVMFPGINYWSGQLFDMQRIAAAARKQGCAVGFDLAHSVGNVGHALHDWDVDFAVWCTYKYLNGGPGAVGGSFVHERHGSNSAIPRLAGWWGNDPKTRFEMRESFEP